MKRIYLIALTLSLSTICFAQKTQVNALGSITTYTSENSLTNQTNFTDVPPFWEQVITPEDSKSSMNSTYYIKDDSGIYSADDFMVGDEGVSIHSILFNGYQLNKSASTLIENVHLYFYLNENDLPQGSPEEPGSEFKKYSFDYSDFLVEDGGEELMGMMTYFLDIEEAIGEKIELEAGHYWLSIVFDIDIDIDDFDERFEWTESLDTHLNDAKFISKAIGIDTWSNTSVFGFDIASFSFTLYGEESILSNSNIGADYLKIYPNPATDAFYISGSQIKQIQGIQAVNTIGQTFQLDYSNGKIDVDHLTKGIYIINIQTSEGMVQHKLIKK